MTLAAPNLRSEFADVTLTAIRGTFQVGTVSAFLSALMTACESNGTDDLDGVVDEVVAADGRFQTAPEPTPTQKPTPSPVPTPEADVSITREFVTAWGDGDPYVNYQVIIELTNAGDGWAQIDAYGSDYQVLDANGGFVTSGSFLYQSPEFLAPGAVGYMVEAWGVADGVTAGQFVTLEVSGKYDDVDGPETTFAFSDLQARAASYDFEGFTVTGFTTTDADTDGAAITVVCVGAEGQPLGATYTNMVENLTSGQPKGFETVMGMPAGLDPSTCVELRAFGDDTGF